MSGSAGWRILTRLLAVAATAVLAGCDEYATTAPEEPPSRERVAEQVVPELVPDLVHYTIELRRGFRQVGYVVVHNGSVYPLESFESLFDDDFDPDLDTGDDPDAWSGVRSPAAHKTASWSDFQLCAECGLVLSEVVRLGDADGPGLIEGTAPGVTWSAQLGYVVVGSTFLQIFDDEGRFVRRIGREGEGPGEFGGIADAHVVGGRLVVLDRPERTWSIFNLKGEFVGRRPYGHPAGPFVPVGDGQVVVVAWGGRPEDFDRSPEASGSPLHLAHIDSGVPSLHFGAGDVRERGRRDRPHANDVRGSVTGRPGTVWWGAAGSPRVQEWSIEGELLRVIEGELPWFPEVTEPADRTREPPPTLLGAMALDTTGHFWMITRTADRDWRDVGLEPGPEGPPIPAGERDGYLDTRLDIFDLEERRHIGRYVWDAAGAGLLDLGNQPAVAIVEYTEEMVPRVVIYRLSHITRFPTRPQEKTLHEPPRSSAPRASRSPRRSAPGAPGRRLRVLRRRPARGGLYGPAARPRAAPRRPARRRPDA